MDKDVQIATCIMRMFNCTLDDFEVLRLSDTEYQITRWDLDAPQPTAKDILGFWQKNKASILKLDEKNTQTELEKRVEVLENTILMMMTGGLQ